MLCPGKIFPEKKKKDILPYRWGQTQDNRVFQPTFGRVWVFCDVDRWLRVVIKESLGEDERQVRLVKSNGKKEWLARQIPHAAYCCFSDLNIWEFAVVGVRRQPGVVARGERPLVGWVVVWFRPAWRVVVVRGVAGMKHLSVAGRTIADLLEVLRKCGDVAACVSEVVPQVVDVRGVWPTTGEERCTTWTADCLLNVAEPV